VKPLNVGCITMSISKFMKKELLSLAPLKVHIVCIIIGGAISVVGLLMKIETIKFKPSLDDSTLSALIDSTFLALGVSILASALVNAIITVIGAKDLNLKAFEQAYYESGIRAKDRIRHSQRIELKFEIIENDHKKYMKLVTRHSFKLCNNTDRKQYYKLMKLFNDYHPPKKHDNIKFECKLYVDSHAIELSHEPKGGKMEIWIKDAKQSIIKIDKDESAHICYEIVNFYSLNDRLIWSFQEISDEVVVAFDTKALLQSDARRGTYSMTILHPEADEIRKKHRRFFDEETGNLNLIPLGAISSEIIPVEIEISNIILPYQGFEIAWKIEIPSEKRWCSICR